MVHWFDELLGQVRASAGGNAALVINGGLSVSGLQHVGRLRGEIVLSHCLARALRDEGRKVTQGLVQYTQDPSSPWHLGSRRADPTSCRLKAPGCDAKRADPRRAM